jgi:hypothetical protein
MMAKGAKVWRPVTSAPNAKFPLPTCNGVELELAFLRTFSDLIIWDLRLHAIAAYEVPISSKNRQRTFCIICHYRCSQLFLDDGLPLAFFSLSIENQRDSLGGSSLVFKLDTK